MFGIHRASASAEIALLRHDKTLARPYVLTNPPFGGREDDGIEAIFRSISARERRPTVVPPDGSLFEEIEDRTIPTVVF